MRSRWYQAILVAVSAAIPGQLLAHPGHEGHGVPISPLTGEDYLAATLIVAGLFCARLVLRKVLRSK